MMVVTTENVPGYRVIDVKGEVFGVVVRSRGLLGNFTATLRSYIGGEIKEYTQMLETGRQDAIKRMVQNATAMGGNAVVMMRFDSSAIDQTMSEIVAYGTAVVLEKRDTVEVLSELICFAVDFYALIVGKQRRYLRIVACQ